MGARRAGDVHDAPGGIVLDSVPVDCLEAIGRCVDSDRLRTGCLPQTIHRTRSRLAVAECVVRIVLFHSRGHTGLQTSLQVVEVRVRSDGGDVPRAVVRVDPTLPVVTVTRDVGREMTRWRRRGRRRLRRWSVGNLAHARIAAHKPRAGGCHSHDQLSHTGRRIGFETGAIERSQFALGRCEVHRVRLGAQRHEIPADAGIGGAGRSELWLRGGAERRNGTEQDEKREYDDSFALHCGESRPFRRNCKIEGLTPICLLAHSDSSIDVPPYSHRIYGRRRRHAAHYCARG